MASLRKTAKETLENVSSASRRVEEATAIEPMVLMAITTLSLLALAAALIALGVVVSER